MQLIEKWKDKRYKADNYLYQLEGGTKLLHTLNPNSFETVVSVLIKGGSYFEKGLNVPAGTAHFLEHMLLSNPNKQHKTKKQIDLYEFGNRKRPYLFINGFTSLQFINFWGKTHSNGSTRLARRILAVIDYPTERFPEFIEKERKVIVAERNSSAKAEKDEYYQFQKSILDEQIKDRVTHVLGEVEDIEKIKKEDLEKLFESVILGENSIIAVQSPEKIAGSFKKNLLKISKRISKNKNNATPHPEEKVKNLYKYKHFLDEREQGIRVILSYFRENPNKIDYREDLLQALTEALVLHVAFNRLREKLGLIYYFDRNTDRNILTEFEISSFKLACDHKDLKKVLDGTFDIFYKYAESFLKTKAGQSWFEDKISRHIFPMTKAYSEEYTDSLAMRIAFGKEIGRLEKRAKIAEKLTREDLLEYLKSSIQVTPPHIWLSSAQKEEDIYKEFEKSKFHKKWSAGVAK